MGPKKTEEKGGKGKEALWDEFLKTVKLQATKFDAPVVANNPVLRFAAQAQEGNGGVPKRLVIAAPLDPLWARVLMYSFAIQIRVFAIVNSLCFWKCELGDKGAYYVASALHMLPNIYKVEMLDCGLGPAACEAFSTALNRRSAGSSLTILRLDHNKLGDQGAAFLSKGLGESNDLNTLSLSYCGIKTEGVKALSKALLGSGKLRTLVLEGNVLGADGVSFLADALVEQKTLTSLNLASTHFANGGDTKEDLKAIFALTQALKENTTLCKINLDDNPVGDAGLKLILTNLAEATHIQELDVTPFVDGVLFTSLQTWLSKNKPEKAGKKGKKGKKK